MTVTHASPVVQKFCDIWKDSFATVLGKLGVVSPSASVIGQPAAAVTSSLDSEKSIMVRFSGGGLLQGDLFWVAEKPVALQCAQLLMSETLDPTLEFTDSHRDAFAELLRQVAGSVATAWKQDTGNEIEIKFQSGGFTSINSPFNAALRLSGEKVPDLPLSLLLSPELCESLSAAPPEPKSVVEPPPPEPNLVVEPPPPLLPEKEAKPAPRFTLPAEPPSAAPTQKFAASPSPSNLDLLLDVELEATIRFGRHEMLLRDIFGLMPGAVVELDQMVNEPAELLVAGRLIARGEVVVVDGNFGLQVTEVASVGQRAEILQF
jgi:flagellar motor switch protein FliN